MNSEADLLKDLLSKTFGKNFKPYSYHCKCRNCLSYYFKDEPYYCKPVNENLELYISDETGEIVGINILNYSSIEGEPREFEVD